MYMFQVLIHMLWSNKVNKQKFKRKTTQLIKVHKGLYYRSVSGIGCQSGCRGQQPEMDLRKNYVNMWTDLVSTVV